MAILELVETPVNKLARASFDNIFFPYDKRTVQGGTRFHLHEYPKVPGAKLEKLGRRAYVIKFDAWFHDLPDTNVETLYPGLYPQELHNLRSLFEEEKTADLSVPGIGTIRAYCSNWSHELDVRVQSGESAHLEFIEDQEEAFLVQNRFEFAATDVEQKLDAFNAAAALAQYKALDELPEPTIFDDIREGVGKVLAVRDQAELYSQMVESKILEVVELCREADKTVQALRDPLNHRVLDAMKDLWAAHVELAQDVLGKGNPIEKYVLPQTMSIAQVAGAIYGDSSRTSDLLALNDIEDVLVIPSGSVLRYYFDSFSNLKP